MDIGYIGDVADRTLIEHATNIGYGINEGTEALLMEDARVAPEADLPTINTCTAVRNMNELPILEREFRSSLGLTGGVPQTHLYGFLGPDGFSEMIEMTASSRLMAGDVGPAVGFVQGAAVYTPRGDIDMALPRFVEVESMLKSLEYVGEVCIGISSGFEITGVGFGHFTGGFSLFNELATTSTQGFYEWCLGVGEGPILHKGSVALSTLLSYPPYPYDGTKAFSVKAPAGAERHLYRLRSGLGGLAYSATWGRDVQEAKRRNRKTIENCKAYNRDLQYRIDFGCRERFLICADKGIKLGC